MKWLRLSLIVALIAVAAFFLWPTVEWYVFIPVPQRDLALGSLGELRACVERSSEADVRQLLALDPSSSIPGQFRYLVADAAGHLQKYTNRPASGWVTGDLLGEYPDRSLLLSDIATHYRTRLFKLRNRSHLVLPLGGSRKGVELWIRADFADMERSRGAAFTSRAQILDTAREILIARANQLTSGTPSVRLVEPDQIVLRIPGTIDIDQARSAVETRGDLSFHIVDDAGNAAIRAYMASGGQAADPSGNIVDPAAVPNFPKGSFIRGVYSLDEYGLEKLSGTAALLEEPSLEGGAIRSASLGRDTLTGGPIVNFVLTSQGGNLFYSLTVTNIGRHLAVILDGRVRASAKIQEPIRDQVRVNGFSESEARNLALILKTGSLPLRLEVISQQALK
jgi:preprotein translocase subunit SecD